MKYYIAISSKNKRHLIAANDEDGARKIAEGNFRLLNIYELEEDTFTEPGFIFND